MLRGSKSQMLNFFYASGELLTIYLDVTLPALHQEAITSREEIYENARQLKAKAYPRKDSAGRLLNESFCLPFILTSMGGLCEEGHEFIRLCKKRNKGATLHLLDVLVKLQNTHFDCDFPRRNHSHTPHNNHRNLRNRHAADDAPHDDAPCDDAPRDAAQRLLCVAHDVHEKQNPH